MYCTCACLLGHDKLPLERCVRLGYDYLPTTAVSYRRRALSQHRGFKVEVDRRLFSGYERISNYPENPYSEIWRGPFGEDDLLGSVLREKIEPICWLSERLLTAELRG
ncbi:hypothetical protein EVAR_6306_1 [Eumeta japonica]|uniref:Uncharacterized protein n=1 Tax=Eumeta variegata TaxID=151549 RepID=A0A4C1T8K9_EUMVA|nr:hypothetical protein EVAR_6306_1 [Eumeta japonica]